MYVKVGVIADDVLKNHAGDTTTAQLTLRPGINRGH